MPRSDFAAVWGEATASCRTARTIGAELALSGSAGGQRLRRRVHVGLASPGRLRLEAPAPFGAPLFILVARDERGTLYFPRDARVVSDAPVPDLLGVLAGIDVGSADLQAILSGCVQPDSTPLAGREYGGDWMAIELLGGTTAWLRRSGERWLVTVGERLDLRVEYDAYGVSAGATPRGLRVRSVAGSAVDFDLTAQLSQVDINVPFDDDVFSLRVDDDVVPITLEELRRGDALEASGLAP